MLNLVAHYVAEEESWMDSADDAKDWGSLLLNGDWEVPPPVWAKSRAREQVLEEKNEKTEESLEGVTSSLLDPSWGKGLPAPSPAVAAPSTPVWRPWEECEVVNLSLVKKRKKRRSPAAAARSQFRLRQWQEKVDRNRPFSGSRTTPQRPVGQVRGTRLLGRLESQRGGESLERVHCPISPLVDSISDVVTASRSNLSMLHTTSLDSIFWQKRAFWGGCGSWGNKIPMA